MKMTILCALLAAGCVNAENLVMNGNFSDGLKNWQAPKWSQNVLENTDTVTPPHAVMMKANQSGEAFLFQTLKLKPDTEYRLKFYIRAKGMKGERGACVYVATPDWKKALHYGPEGLWKYLKGDTDWCKGEFQFNSKYFQAATVNLGAMLTKCEGSALFDSISLEEIPAKTNQK